MKFKTLGIISTAVLIVLSSSAFSAKLVTKSVVKPAVMNQQQALDKFWNAPDNTIVGTVNGIRVTKAEVMKKLWYWNGPAALQDLLSQKMIESAAKKSGVTLTSKEIDAKANESVKKMGLKSVDQLLKQYKVTRDRFYAGVKINTLAEKSVQKDIKITDADYSKWIKASHILIRFADDEKDKDKKEADAKAKIDEIATKIKNGEDFAKLATEYTEDPGSKTKAGELGWFSSGRMVQEFEKAAFALEPGQVSEPVKTVYGYHIIKLEKSGKNATPAEKADLKAMILATRVPKELGQWFGDLMAKSKIVNYLMPEDVVKPQPKSQLTPIKNKTVTPSQAPQPSEEDSDMPPPPPGR